MPETGKLFLSRGLFFKTLLEKHNIHHIDTFVKKHSTTKNEPKCKLWTFVNVNTTGSSLITNVPLMQDVNSRRSWRRGSVWELSVVSVQLFCESKTTLKTKGLLSKYTIKYTHRRFWEDSCSSIVFQSP